MESPIIVPTTNRIISSIQVKKRAATRRKSSQDLEKRRIHFCDYEGNIISFKSLAGKSF